MHPDELDAQRDVEEILVLRVVSAAHRRRVRRAVVGGLLVIIAACGVAIGMTHRSGAVPIAASTPAISRVLNDATRAEIYAVARARYAHDDPHGVPNRASRTHVEFGPLTVHGDRVRMAVDFVCLPMCGHGEEITFAELAGTWQVVGVRTTWWS